MSSPIRTALVGAGVAAICIAMASLKGHHLLIAFAAASVLGAAWSWTQRNTRPLTGKALSDASESRRRSRGEATVYQFPGRQLQVSDMSS